MKNNPKIISSVLAVIFAIIDFAKLSLDRSLCSVGTFQAPGDFEKMVAFCYEKYPNSRFVIEITAVFLLTYLIVFFATKLLKRNHEN